MSPSFGLCRRRGSFIKNLSESDSIVSSSIVQPCCNPHLCSHYPIERDFSCFQFYRFSSLWARGDVLFQVQEFAAKNLCCAFRKFSGRKALVSLMTFVPAPPYQRLCTGLQPLYTCPSHWLVRNFPHLALSLKKLCRVNFGMFQWITVPISPMSLCVWLF